MPSMRRRSLLGSLLAGFGLLCATYAPTNADIIYIGDDLGRVGQYDTVTMTGSLLGDLSAFSVGQSLGLAYDAATDAVLILDRSAGTVYTMDAQSGSASVLFSGAPNFQGGAVADNLLYGTNESSQTVQAFSFAGVDQGLSGPIFASHTHAMGVDPATGQLYLIGTDDIIYNVNDDGTLGASVVTATGLQEFVDDLDYFQGDFLAAQYGSQTVYSIDGMTGISSQFLSAAQVGALGLTAGISGVAVRFGEQQAVPEPGTWALLAAGVLPAGTWLARRRRK